MATKLVDTATLVRGKVFAVRIPASLQKPGDTLVKPLRFKKGIPVVIDNPAVLDYLEDMVDDVPDGDGEIFEKPRFAIERGVEEPEDNNAYHPRRTRLDAKRSVRKTRTKRTTK